MIESFIFAKVKFYHHKKYNTFPCYSSSGDQLTLEFLLKLDEGRNRYTFRILYPPKEITYGEECVVQIRFLVPSLVMPLLKVDKYFEIEWGKVIGEGKVLEIHDYGDMIGPWDLSTDPWCGMPFKHPNFYLRLRNDKYPACACFVSRQFSDGCGNCFHVSRVAPSLCDYCHEIVLLKFSGGVGNVVEVWKARRDDTGELMMASYLGVGVIGSWDEVSIPKKNDVLQGLKDDELLQMQQLFHRLLTLLLPNKP